MAGAFANFELELLLHVRHTENNVTNQVNLNSNGNSIIEAESNGVQSGESYSLIIEN